MISPMSDSLNIEHIRHSLAHLLAAAVLELYPDAKLTLGPAIETGFYYDFDFETRMDADTQPPQAAPFSKGDKKTRISDADLPKIEQKMREILKSWKGFEGKEMSGKEARKLFKGNPYKLELIDEIEKKSEKITLYTSGAFTDLCRGGHVSDAKELRGVGWKLDRIAGAYWRGDEKNKMLTRVYGLAFATKEELEAYLKQREEAKERDHRKLGEELDLFAFSELVGAGLPLWTPRGTVIRDLLDDAVWKLRKKYGYERVDIPHLAKKELYETSGHWEKFGDDLFKIRTREKHAFALKPMNCPHHIEIFRRKAWSYREVPARYASTTKVYRDEQSGELSGLSRVRAITQDDAHVFCRHSQIKEEMAKIWGIIEAFYGRFGFILSPRLSLHDPRNMAAYLGEKTSWDKAETELRELVKEKKAEAIEAVGEAAFYGPKIDFMAKDSLGREWQVATIQLDMNMPERFNLSCANENGKQERLAMIHAAIMGSLERFLSILIEHYGGAFPLWLAPVQVKVLPVSERFTSYARKANEALLAAEIRSELDESNETLGKKVRAAKLEKVPYWIVVGEKEEKSGTVALESREGKKTTDTITNIISFLGKEKQ